MATRRGPAAAGRAVAVLLLAVFCAPRRALGLDNGLGRERPAFGWSSWNRFRCAINSQLIRATADAMVSSGLRDAGFTYVNIDDCWQSEERDPSTGALVPDPAKFPSGMKAVADYVHSRGLLLGIYTSRGDHTCQGRPGSRGHEALDARTFASWGVDYLKLDSCKDSNPATFDDPDVAWAQYAAMRDALNATGRPVWLSLTGRVAYNDSQWHRGMHCIHPPRPHGYPNEFGAFTVRPWVRSGKDVASLANSYLIEYCNNAAYWGCTNAAPCGPGGFLSQLDSQQLLTWDNLTAPGAFNDNDMLEVCNPNPHRGTPMTAGELRAQVTTFAVLSSPLILGHDVRNQSKACLDVIANSEVLALADTTRATLVLQFPTTQWPNAGKVPPGQTSDGGGSGGDGEGPPADKSQAPATGAGVGGGDDTPVNITVQVWAKRLSRVAPGAGGRPAVGVVVLNRGSAPASVNVTWAMVGLPPGTAAAARDLWAHTDNGTHTGHVLVGAVAPHDVVALTLTPA